MTNKITKRDNYNELRNLVATSTMDTIANVYRSFKHLTEYETFYGAMLKYYCDNVSLYGKEEDIEFSVDRITEYLKSQK